MRERWEGEISQVIDTKSISERACALEKNNHKQQLDKARER